MITHVSNENDEGLEIILTIEKMKIRITLTNYQNFWLTLITENTISLHVPHRITQKQEQEEKLDKNTMDAAKLVLVVSLIPKS
ncbi:hypothetical protein WN944_025062 [Citrus x changshan-huyou]|uniref:Uncharacterized protein n=1 Tax=Citrus x changshan-huyou TaxID=2935761 RepID=A0AAP0LPR2_9ROSI